MSKQGSLVCVGSGMRLAGQLTPRAKSCIEQADVVLAAMANHLSRQWIKEMSKEYRCLLDLYGEGGGEGKPRGQTYDEMAERIMEEVRKGRKVCAVFYGHPSVFSCISKKAIDLARAEAFPAHMEPGISAADCLYADLEIDPASAGEQAMECTQFMIHQRRIDPSALLILWQPGVAGDLSMKRFETHQAYIKLLVEKLSRNYPLDHEVILYEAATSPLESTRIEHLPLGKLPQATLNQITTLVVPPCQEMATDSVMLDKLQILSESVWETA
ncbi:MULTISPECIES: SAM-dependent methyltransferase [Ferrimonas]|uniref:SAM-dependent methyltransferase n=1 Tax=Ferrimonas TaxID=44011 RepID=UPI00041B8680|nr:MULTISPECIES: SAM-dependent methyltransferase [Ferrimonas]USD39723.1 hypothetical protein J8Z22_08895 [Ferrimonas sp. SCSIO 43195]